MSFKEYPHIENTYQTKCILELKEEHPEALLLNWVVEEKINGTNIQINISRSGEYNICSRGREIPVDEDHMGIKVFLREKFQTPLQILIQCAIKSKQHLRLYGEFFGPGICKGVEYGKYKRLVFFGVMINDVFQSPSVLYQIFNDLHLSKYVITPLKIGSFDDALYYNPVFVSQYSPVQDEAEGVVIKPYQTVIIDNHYLPIYFKNKNLKFEEKQREKDTHSDSKAADGVLLDYLNDNRINSCFSKEGPISSKKDMKKYIDLIRQDIISDWQTDHGDIALDTKEFRVIGPAIAKYLLPYLKQEGK